MTSILIMLTSSNSNLLSTFNIPQLALHRTLSTFATKQPLIIINYYNH